MNHDESLHLQDKENKLYVMKIIDMSRMDTKQRKDHTLPDLDCEFINSV